MRRRPTGLAVAAVTLVAIAAWTLRGPAGGSQHRVVTGDVVAEAFGVGTLEARVAVSVGPKVTGRLVEVAVDEGQRVARGDLLLRLDDAELARHVAMGLADVQAADAGRARARAETTRAQAVLDAAAREMARVSELVQRTITSRAELDRAVDAHAVAEAALAAARAGEAEAARREEAAAQALAVAQARLDETRVVCPVDGLVVRRLREPGDVVVSGSAVLTVAATDEMWVRAWVDESELPRLAPDLPARVVFRAEPDRSYPGAVARVGREVDRETREVLVDVRVDALPARWALGQRADAFIEVGRAQAAPVLSTALLVWRDGAAGVEVLEGQRPRWRPVRLGLQGIDTVEVLDGVAPGDVVVRGAP